MIALLSIHKNIDTKEINIATPFTNIVCFPRLVAMVAVVLLDTQRCTSTWTMVSPMAASIVDCDSNSTPRQLLRLTSPIPSNHVNL